MPYIDIDNIVTIKRNLLVLASFETNNKSKAKLTINKNGEFREQNGVWGSITRNDDDSLKNADNIKTIKKMFENAMSYMNKIGNPPAEKRVEETRKQIVDGLRGLYFLWYKSYRGRAGYSDLEKVIKKIGEDLSFYLLILGNSSLWYQEICNASKMKVRSQKDYYENPRGGICWGICTDWCRRFIIKGRESFEDSPKMQQMTTAYIKEVARQIKSKNLPIQEGKLLFEKAGLAFAALRKDFDFDFDRLRKKGPDMAVVQHAQKGVKTGEWTDMSDALAVVFTLREELQSEVQNDVINLLVSTDGEADRNMAVSLDSKQMEKKRDKLLKLNEALSAFDKKYVKTGLPTLVNAQNKYAHIQILKNIKVPFLMHMRDRTDFVRFIQDEVTKCETFRTSNPPVQTAFIISYSSQSGEGQDLDLSGHAMAYHGPLAADKKFYVMDPNFGEFSCTTINDVILVFSGLFSFYSFSKELTGITCNFLRIKTT
ncbi:MAG: hypothetical protein WCJ40_18415 [Planctomycetota bacterium]